MTIRQSAKAADASLARDLLHAARFYLGGRRGILVVATIAVLAGIGLSWNWLVAAGIAPILLTALPCLVMCGLGLCMNKMAGNSCASKPAASKAAEAPEPESASNVRINSALAGESACCHTDPANKTATVQALEQRRDTHA